MKSNESKEKWKVLLPYGADEALSGEISTSNQMTDQSNNSLCLTIQFVRAIPQNRTIRCLIGFNPKVEPRDNQAFRAVLDGWEAFRIGIEDAIHQMQTQDHPLPIRANDLIFVHCTAPLGLNQPTIINIGCDYGRNRRKLITLRDAYEQYLQLPLRDRVKLAWQRLLDANASQAFKKQARVYRFCKRLDDPTPAEMYIKNPVKKMILERAFDQHLRTPVRALFTAIYSGKRLTLVRSDEPIACRCAPDEATSG